MIQDWYTQLHIKIWLLKRIVGKSAFVSHGPTKAQDWDKCNKHMWTLPPEVSRCSYYEKLRTHSLKFMYLDSVDLVLFIINEILKFKL